MFSVIDDVRTTILMITNQGRSYATLDWTRPDLADHLAMYNLTADFHQGSMFAIGVTNLTRVVTGPCGKNITYNYDVTVAGQYLGYGQHRKNCPM